MSLDSPPNSEIPRKPQSIRELYDSFVSQIGKGTNPLFTDLPDNVIFWNQIGSDKPFFYVEDGNNHWKQGLTSDDMNVIKEKQNFHEDTLEDITFDMFSLMVGGRRPTIYELGVNHWTDLLSQMDTNSPIETKNKLQKLFNFLDHRPDDDFGKSYYAALNESLSEYLHLSNRMLRKQNIAHEQVIITVRLEGDVGFDRGKVFVWSAARNFRSPIQTSSPFKDDGGIFIDQMNDVSIGYETDDGPKLGRLNTFVFLLARHGLSEETTKETAADQMYIGLNDYAKYIYHPDGNERQRFQNIENENYVIKNKLGGYEKLQRERKKMVLDKMISLAQSGGLDDVLSTPFISS